MQAAPYRRCESRQASASTACNARSAAEGSCTIFLAIFQGRTEYDQTSRGRLRTAKNYSQNDERPGVKLVGWFPQTPYHHYRKSVLLVLHENATNTSHSEATSILLQSLIKDLENRGAKEYKYWVENPDRTLASIDELNPGSMIRTKVAEGARRHRARRYLRRLFGSASEFRKK